MILINNKDFNSLSNSASNQLMSQGFNTSPGSIAKLFADIINKHISDFYDVLTINHVQAFVTTATGDFLDSIGFLLNCIRNYDEDDENYRKRITHQTLSMSKANETSIRLAALSCEGVDDVVLKKFSHGPGSFTVVPVTKTRNSEQILAVHYAIEEVSSYGEKVVVKFPELKYVKMNVGIVYSNSVDDIKKQAISITVREEIIKYINSLKVGEPFIVNELTQRIMQVDENIVNYSCDSFKINNNFCLLINQGVRWDEKFAISPDANSIIVI